VSWAAVVAGAFVAAALWLILLALGAGIGLSSVSPWSNLGASATSIGRAAIVWMIIVQIIASAMGGYLAGRLRIRWATIHTDEVYFRDTAHGFLVWAVGLVIAAVFLASTAASIVGARAPSPASTGRAEMPASPLSDRSAFDPNEYFISALFRSDRLNSARNDVAAKAEARLIFANALRQKNLSAADTAYLAKLVAASAGIGQADAEGRVSEVFAQLQREADAARKATAHVFLWLFVALLIGAFSASYAATIGGRQRDEVRLV
jgi:hypothetical protein